MEVLLGLVGADMADRTLGTADRVRAVNLDAVQGDQQTPAEALERLQGALLAQRVEAQREELASGGRPSSRFRIWLLHGMCCTPSRLWQLERELSCCMRRWKLRKEGDCTKNTEKAQATASATA